MNFGIVSDSSCDLPESYVQTEQVEIVSFYLSFDGEEYYREEGDFPYRSSISGWQRTRIVSLRLPCRRFRTMWAPFYLL